MYFFHLLQQGEQLIFKCLFCGREGNKELGIPCHVERRQVPLPSLRDEPTVFFRARPSETKKPFHPALFSFSERSSQSQHKQPGLQSVQTRPRVTAGAQRVNRTVLLRGAVSLSSTSDSVQSDKLMAGANAHTLTYVFSNTLLLRSKLAGILIICTQAHRGCGSGRTRKLSQ